MGLSKIIKNRNASVSTGIHLLLIDAIRLHKNKDGSPTMTQTGEGLITITFADKDNNKIDRTYLIGTEKQKSFDKVMADARINTSEGASVKQAIGKRLYGAVKEVITVDQNGEQTGKEYVLFKTFPYIEDKAKPSLIGDPEKNNGIPSHDFIQYNQENNIPFLAKENLPFEPTHVKEGDQWKPIENLPKIEF